MSAQQQVEKANTSSSNNASSAQEVAALKKQVAELQNELSENAKKAGQVASNGLHLAKDELADAAHRAGRNVRGFLSHKNDQLHDLRDQTEQTITKHPFGTTAAAFGAGLLIAALMRR